MNEYSNYGNCNTSDVHQREQNRRLRKQRFWMAMAVTIFVSTLVVVPSLLIAHSRRRPNNDNQEASSTSNPGKGDNTDDDNDDDADFGAQVFVMTRLDVSQVTQPDQPLDCAVDLVGSDLTLLVANDDDDDQNNNNNDDLAKTKTYQLFLRYSAPDSLCMLVRTDGNQSWIPLVRSYHGEAWESYRSDPNYPVTCDDDIETCTIPIVVVNQQPSHEEEDQQREDNRRQRRRLGQRRLEGVIRNENEEDGTGFFALAYRPPPALDNSINEYARFLEQTTFGTTRKDLNSLLERHEAAVVADTTTSTVKVMAQWMDEQMNVIPPTLHREFYRTHAMSRFATSSQTGAVTQPCQEYTAYRKFALVEQHYQKLLDIATTDDKKYRLLRVDNVVLTVLSTQNGPIQLLPSEDGSTLTNNTEPTRIFVDGR